MQKKIDRLMAILATLNSEYSHLDVTARSLAEKSEVCEKTILRDIQELNYMFDKYLIDHKSFPYDYDDETDPIYFDWSRKSFRIRDEFMGMSLGQLWGFSQR